MLQRPVLENQEREACRPEMTMYGMRKRICKVSDRPHHRLCSFPQT